MTYINYMSFFFPNEIWNIINLFDPTYPHNILHKVHIELLQNCVRRDIEELDNTRTHVIAYECTLHKNIHTIYSDIKYWKDRGWCTAKCGSLNWPHVCNFCLICNADPDYCSCINT